jgi:hypothetical protein
MWGKMILEIDKLCFGLDKNNQNRIIGQSNKPICARGFTWRSTMAKKNPAPTMSGCSDLRRSFAKAYADYQRAQSEGNQAGMASARTTMVETHNTYNAAGCRGEEGSIYDSIPNAIRPGDVIKDLIDIGLLSGKAKAKI